MSEEREACPGRRKWRDYIASNTGIKPPLFRPHSAPCTLGPRDTQNTWTVSKVPKHGPFRQHGYYIAQSTSGQPKPNRTDGELLHSGWSMRGLLEQLDRIPPTPRYDRLCNERTPVPLIWPLPPDYPQVCRKLDQEREQEQVNPIDAPIALSYEDLQTVLRPSAWLNDQIINAYLKLLDRDLGSSHSFSTFFYPKLLKQGFDSVAKWTRNVNIFDFDVVLFPVHLGVHWTLAYYSTGSLHYCDGLGACNTRVLECLKGYMEREHMVKLHRELRVDIVGMDKSLPKQLNGFDCGVFLLVYALSTVLWGVDGGRKRWGFEQRDMQYFRRRVGYELLKNKLFTP